MKRYGNLHGNSGIAAYIGMKNTLGLNGCGISAKHILCGIMERDGIGKI